MLVFTHGSQCHAIEILDEQLQVTEITELESNHEEADTRLLLHAAQTSYLDNSIVILCPDKDVVSQSFSKHIRAQLYFAQLIKGIKKIDINAINKSLGDNICQALIGLHVYTGCDSVSSFKGKSKLKSFKIMCETEKYISTFKELGKLWIMNIDVREFRNV